MSTWYYYDKDGQKKGPVTGGQLKGLAKTGRITPETVVETEKGKTSSAQTVKGLTFIEAAQPETAPTEPNPFAAPPPVSDNPFSAALTDSTLPSPASDNPFAAAPPPTQPFSVPPSPSDAPSFCTNCGNPVGAQVVACLSCGAKPTGHKRFCRGCGAGLNPEQVVCIKCGTGLADVSLGDKGKEFSAAASEKGKELAAATSAKGKELAQRGKEEISKGAKAVMSGLSAAKDAARAQVKQDALNSQLVAVYCSLGDAAEQAGWGGDLCGSIKKQREEVAAITAQYNKAVADVEATKSTPGAEAAAAQQALVGAKKQGAQATGVLNNLREKLGRALLDDASAPANIVTDQQRAEITRLQEEIAECERITAGNTVAAATA